MARAAAADGKRRYFRSGALDKKMNAAACACQNPYDAAFMQIFMTGRGRRTGFGTGFVAHAFNIIKAALKRFDKCQRCPLARLA